MLEEVLYCCYYFHATAAKVRQASDKQLHLDYSVAVAVSVK